MLARPRKQRQSDVNERIKKIHNAIADKLMLQPELFEEVEKNIRNPLSQQNDALWKLPSLERNN